MLSDRSFAVIGGDMRQIGLISSLLKDGERVRAFGFDNAAGSVLECEKTLASAISDSTAVILPLPASTDGAYINAPLYDGKIKADELLGQMKANQLLLGGRMGELAASAEERGIRAVDYLEREELAVLNAALTAEGALEIAMRETETALCMSKCLVVGYGRIGKLLCKMLDGIGATPCVAARSHEALAWAEAYGINSLHVREIANAAGEYDVIFNTVPHLILTEEIIRSMSADTLVVDLASRPGGVDFAAAERYGIKAVWALSLPGKTAPISAGGIIAKAVMNICVEMGV